MGLYELIKKLKFFFEKYVLDKTTQIKLSNLLIKLKVLKHETHTRQNFQGESFIAGLGVYRKLNSLPRM